MNIEQHVVSLELAKQLKEAGYPQETLFYWIGIEGEVGDLCRKGEAPLADFILNNDEKLKKYVPEGFCYAAPLASELGEHLKFLGNYLEITHWKHGWRVYDKDHGGFQEDFNLSDCLAKMWLYLKQNNLLQEKETE